MVTSALENWVVKTTLVKMFATPEIVNHAKSRKKVDATAAKKKRTSHVEREIPRTAKPGMKVNG